MSGIMAIVSLDGRPIPPELPRAQLAAIAHRGEWEPRLWEAPGVALGHVNLPRTPEAEREFLPMSDRSGRYWLTWDGRLDNRDELAPRLGHDPAERAEKTDANYVLDAFIKWGDDCVHYLLGDWAVVIWDNEARRLFCAKDPLGWRQLYHAEREGLLAVGSEPQQFFAGGWFPKTVDPDHVRAWLADVERSATTTCYLGIRSLCGGTAFTAHHAKSRENQFWISPKGRPVRRDVPSLVEELADTFSRVVKAQMRSNLPVGVFLSGGLDSSYVAAVAAARGAKTAVAGFAPHTKRFDERSYIRLVQEDSGLPVEWVDLSDCWPLSSRWISDEMFDDVSMPIQSAIYVKLARAAQDAGVGVVLAGEGADEWVDGHPTAIGALGEGRRLLARELFSALGLKSRRSKVGLLVSEALESLLPSALIRLTRLGNEHSQADPDRTHFISGKLGKPISRPDPIPLWRRKRRSVQEWQIYRANTVSTVAWRERHTLNPSGIELRNPFNDLRVVEFMSSVSAPTKRFDGRSKAILRAAEAGVVPPAVANRRDFGTIGELVVEPLWHEEHARVAEGIEGAGQFKFLHAERVRNRAAMWLSAPNQRERDLTWRLITCGLWVRQLATGDRPSATATVSTPAKLLVREGVRA